VESLALVSNLMRYYALMKIEICYAAMLLLFAGQSWEKSLAAG